MTIERLRPTLPAGEAYSPTARWVGEIQLGDDFAETVVAEHAQGYQWARLLVRDGTTVCGFIEVGVDDGTLIGREIAREAGRLPSRRRDNPPRPVALPPPVTVAVCTRDRTSALIRVVDSLLALDYPVFEVLVVDNAAESLDTYRFAETHNDPRVRVIHAGVPGLAAARNRALEAARHDIVAFTDDDVVADRHWLTCLVRSFTDPDVACVTGLVPAAQLRTVAQTVFDQRIGWSSSVRRRLFRLSDAHNHDHLFPFRVADFGTGANFAVRRDIAFALGGFDEALGAGAPTRGGEDIDWFVRTLAAGHSLAFEPDAIVWHQHREDDEQLLTQARGYGLGLGAWMTKVMTDRELAPLALSRIRHAIGHLGRSLLAGSAGQSPIPTDAAPAVADAAHAERSGLLAGPAALFAARAQGRKKAPFKQFPVQLAHPVGSESGGEPSPH